MYNRVIFGTHATMFFNSIIFAIFLPLVFFIYWSKICNTPRKRNICTVLAGFVFYGWWDVRFLALMVGTAMIDYYVTKAMEQTDVDKKRKRLLYISLISNLAVLFFFKYFNFFVDSFAVVLETVGMKPDFVTLNIVLPVGISFYTFQALSYTIDVYQRKIKAAPDAITYMAYICFFPQLVAGPIERATHLMPQFGTLHRFSSATAIAGLRLMLWGYFKKCVIADNMAPYADSVFAAGAHPNATGVLLGTVAFALQAYGDFSGYSDIAKGAARLFGFELVYNFRFPYFASSMRDYWHRWHISMSSWFRDYVYIPLGGSKKGIVRSNVNIFVTFVLSGLWHGANWTFVMWGAWHGIAQPIENLYNHFRGPKFPKPLRHLLVLLVAWGSYIFLRSPDIATAIERFAAFGAFDWSLNPSDFGTAFESQSPRFFWGLVGLTIILFGAEWMAFKNRFGWFYKMPKVVRLSTYYVLIIVLLLYGVYQAPPAFIYFQF